MKSWFKAFAEDSLSVYNDIQRHVSQTGGVAVCVVTPEIRKFARAVLKGSV